MATFLMFGKYSSESLKKISTTRTDRAVKLIKKFGGQIISMYALLGRYDLVLIVELPGTDQAMQASLALNKMTGISFTTSPAVIVDDFDKLAQEV